MLKFRKGEIFWLKSQRFGCAKSRKRQFEGRFPGKKSVKIGVFLVKFVNLVHVQLREPDQCATGENTKKAVPPHSGIIVSRLEKGLFFVKISRNFPEPRVINKLKFWTF